MRVVIVSEIRLYRDGLAEVLRRDGRLSVIAEASDVRRVLESVRDNAPDAMLVDMGIPDALRTIKLVRAEAPDLRIIALGVSERPADVVACAEAGIAGYVGRQGSVEQLVETVERAVRGELECPPQIAAALLRQVAELASRTDRSELNGDLTAREIEVFRLVDEGLSNKEIARRLNIQMSTVKNHVHNGMVKIGVSQRAKAVAALRKLGALHPARAPRP